MDVRFINPFLCCFSWNWRIRPFELHLLACEKEV